MKTTGKFIEVDGIPREEPDLLVWARWFDKADRTVARTRCLSGTEISTVFLGLNHNWEGGAPLLYETMVFGGPCNQEQERYATRAEAQAGHDRMVAMVREKETLNA